MGGPSDLRFEPEPTPERRSRGCVQAATRYIPWADLLRRVHDIDALCCPKCGAGLRMISGIMDPCVVRAFLGSIGLPCEPPVIARARSPTLFEHRGPPESSIERQIDAKHVDARLSVSRRLDSDRVFEHVGQRGLR
jgi:hypothetical protein